LQPETDDSIIESSVSANVPPIRAHESHLANTTELVLPSDYPSPQTKWQIDLFSYFLHSLWQSVSGYARACPFK